MPANLDDAKALAKLDAGGMLGLMDRFVDAFKESFAAASKGKLKAANEARGIVLCGMGGSGIGGDLTQRLAEGASKVPVQVVKGYSLPAWVAKGAVVVAVSYSGRTEETLSLARQAVERGARLFTISSGGDLAQLGASKAEAHFPVPGGRPPRVALPELFGTILGLFHSLGVGVAPLEGPAERAVREVHDRVRPTSPEARNAAKECARALHQRFPVWYGSGILAPVAVRGRCQLNENAKMEARDDVLPEANHNDLVALNALTDGPRYFFGMLRETPEHPQVTRRFDFLATVLHRVQAGLGSFAADGPTPLSRMLQALLFVDYVSVYAAFLRGLDPTPVDVIADLKKTIGETPKPAPAIRR